MGGEVGCVVVVGVEGCVKSLGLVFEDECKGCYFSGEMVVGYVLLEVFELVVLCVLCLEV